MRIVLWLPAVSMVMWISGCGAAGMFYSPHDDASASAKVLGLAPSTTRGNVFFRPVPNKGLRIEGRIEGLIPGHSYAVFIYENGNCSDEQSPGNVFDPGNSGRHGRPGLSPQQHNAGDLPNYTANEDGILDIDFTTDALEVGRSSHSVIGRSIVIHAGPSDFTTQPFGDSGAIIACGVIKDGNQTK